MVAETTAITGRVGDSFIPLARADNAEITRLPYVLPLPRPRRRVRFPKIPTH